ncbi:hypothetical protein J6590_079298 [Homalodisca vitripennis]|nr:hypothetical protein J6590_097935 [Homalodisca vitripennis]KAG8280564.1 hypothetical protein J6590_079298 [Homalodisca vitripennis]
MPKVLDVPDAGSKSQSPSEFQWLSKVVSCHKPEARLRSSYSCNLLQEASRKARAQRAEQQRCKVTLGYLAVCEFNENGAKSVPLN